jgi:hypothetical protein
MQKHQMEVVPAAPGRIPDRNVDCPDRSVDCLVALVPGFRELVDTAESAGWTEDEIAASLLALVHVYRDKQAKQNAICH